MDKHIDRKCDIYIRIDIQSAYSDSSNNSFGRGALLDVATAMDHVIM